jgi:hypothetical protein
MSLFYINYPLTIGQVEKEDMNMNTIFSKTASILALVIGAMGIYAGGQVLLGSTPGYNVIPWLPVYNFSVGVITFFFITILIWKNNRFALTAAVSTLAVHSIVLMILQTAYANFVAPDSIQAMIIRITVWMVIIALLLLQRWISARTQLANNKNPS